MKIKKHLSVFFSFMFLSFFCYGQENVPVKETVLKTEYQKIDFEDLDVNSFKSGLDLETTRREINDPRTGPWERHQGDYLLDFMYQSSL